MTDDDDYPVLTEVLRTRSRRLHPPAHAAAGPVPGAEEPETVETLLPPQLVVGHDAQAELQHYAETDGSDDTSPVVAASNEVLFELAPEPASAASDVVAVTTSVAATDYFTHPDEPVARPLPAASPIDAEAFALQVQEAVLEDLNARVDTELDARIAQTLHAALETALAQLQGSLRAELAEALRDVVGHAVDDAVRRLRDRASGDDFA